MIGLKENMMYALKWLESRVADLFTVYNVRVYTINGEHMIYD